MLKNFNDKFHQIGMQRRFQFINRKERRIANCIINADSTPNGLLCADRLLLWREGIKTRHQRPLFTLCMKVVLIVSKEPSCLIFSFSESGKVEDSIMIFITPAEICCLLFSERISVILKSALCEIKNIQLQLIIIEKFFSAYSNMCVSGEFPEVSCPNPFPNLCRFHPVRYWHYPSLQRRRYSSDIPLQASPVRQNWL